MPLAPAFAVGLPRNAPAFNPRRTPIPISPPRSPTRMTAASNGTAPPAFTITKTVMPADSDYSMSLWHGSYIRWLEEARVRYLSYMKLPYSELVRVHNTELVVRDLSLRYLAPAKLGDDVSVTIRLAASDSRVRIPIRSEFVRKEDGTTCATALVTIVPVDAATGKLRRVWPLPLTDALREAMEAARAAAE